MSEQTNTSSGLAAGWNAWRQPDSRTWHWAAFGPAGGQSGTARSEKEAREKASRAAEDLRHRRR